MIDRKTVEWFVNRALEYQEIGAEDYTHDYRFEIGTRGSTAIIWQRDTDENGVCMWYYESRDNSSTYLLGDILTVHDPLLVEARKHVEKLMKQARIDWAEQHKKEVNHDSV